MTLSRCAYRKKSHFKSISRGIQKCILNGYTSELRYFCIQLHSYFCLLNWVADKMCTPSSTEMYRVANFGNPETYPGTFGEIQDKIEVVSEENSLDDLEVNKM